MATMQLVNSKQKGHVTTKVSGNQSSGANIYYAHIELNVSYHQQSVVGMSFL